VDGRYPEESQGAQGMTAEEKGGRPSIKCLLGWGRGAWCGLREVFADPSCVGSAGSKKWRMLVKKRESWFARAQARKRGERTPRDESEGKITAERGKENGRLRKEEGLQAPPTSPEPEKDSAWREAR